MGKLVDTLKDSGEYVDTQNPKKKEAPKAEKKIKKASK